MLSRTPWVRGEGGWADRAGGADWACGGGGVGSRGGEDMKSCLILGSAMGLSSSVEGSLVNFGILFRLEFGII